MFTIQTAKVCQVEGQIVIYTGNTKMKIIAVYTHSGTLHDSEMDYYPPDPRVSHLLI